MLIMTAGGFDFTAADCMDWLREIGFRDIRTEPLAGEISMVVGIKTGNADTFAESTR